MNFKLKGFLCQGYSQFPYYYVIMMEEFTPMQERRFLTEILDNAWIDTARLWTTCHFTKFERRLGLLDPDSKSKAKRDCIIFGFDIFDGKMQLCIMNRNFTHDVFDLKAIPNSESELVFNGEKYFRKIESLLKELNNLENIK